MPKSKLTKFCKITKYLEQEDYDLYRVIDDLCLHSIFIPRGVNGITFLMPKEKKIRDEILKNAYSDEAEKAEKILRSMVIQDYLPDASSFLSKQDDIPNQLGQKICIDEKGSDPSKGVVKFSCGGEARPDKKFQPFKRGNMAVYLYTGRPIPLDSPACTYEHAKSKRGKTGGGAFGGSSSDLLRLLREKVFSRREVAPVLAASLKALLHLIWYCHTNDHKDDIKLIKSQMSEDPLATLLICLDPIVATHGVSCKGGWVREYGRLDPNQIRFEVGELETWRNFSANLDESKVKVVKGGGIADERNPAAKDIEALGELYKKAKVDLVAGTSKATLGSALKSVYETMWKDGKIGGVPIWDPAVKKIMAGSHMHKMSQDELRLLSARATVGDLEMDIFIDMVLFGLVLKKEPAYILGGSKLLTDTYYSVTYVFALSNYCLFLPKRITSRFNTGNLVEYKSGMPYITSLDIEGNLLDFSTAVRSAVESAFEGEHSRGRNVVIPGNLPQEDS